MFVNFSSLRFQKIPEGSECHCGGRTCENVGHDTERVQYVWMALSHHVAGAFLGARASSQHEPLLPTAWVGTVRARIKLLSFSIPICLTQNRYDDQLSSTDPDIDAQAHSPHPEVDMLGRDQHSSEYQVAVEALNECRAHWQKT